MSTTVLPPGLSLEAIQRGLETRAARRAAEKLRVAELADDWNQRKLDLALALEAAYAFATEHGIKEEHWPAVMLNREDKSQWVTRSQQR